MPSIEKIHPEDLFESLERTVSGAEYENEKRISLPTWLVRHLLDFAKRAPNKRPGRQPLRRYQRLAEYFAILTARRRKAQLVAGGMRKEEATNTAAMEATAALGNDRNLSASTIRRRMQRRRRS